jgi:sensor histidine kinase YesM
MSHPFTSQRRALIIYSLVWVFIAALDASFLRFNREFSLSISITEALIGTVFFGLMGLIIWYPTRYIPYRSDAPIYSISAHIAAGVIVILAWLFITVGILGAIFVSEEGYQTYLTSSLFLRGLVGVILYLVLVLIYYLVSYARSLRERAQAEEKLRTLVKESELNMLKSQINPHFLFNSLNSISSLIVTNPDEAREMIVRLSDFLRYSLKHRENEYVSIEEEIGRMNDYLSVERIRFGDKLKYELHVSEKYKKLKVPTMIMQPLIENAIKHGVYESLEPVSVEFNCDIKDGFLKLELKNDFDPETPSKPGTGVGLQNVSERIQLAYDGQGRVNRSVKDGVFKVTLHIPLDKK